MTYTKILVPLDGSQIAERALPHAAALAAKFGAELVLLRAVSPPGAVFPVVVPSGAAAVHPAGVMDPTPLLEAERQEATRYLTTTAAALGSTGSRVLCEQHDGDPAEVILRSTRELGADLIVMTSHGRGGLGRLIFGSVTDAVLRGAPSPVLVIRVRE